MSHSSTFDVSGFEVALAAASIGCWRWDRGTGAYVCSPEVFRLLGVDLRTDVCMQVVESRLHPDDRKAFREAMAPGEAAPEVAKIVARLKSDGEEGYQYLRICNTMTFDEAGRCQGFRGIVQDVSSARRMEEERHASESMLRLVLDTIPIRIFWKDRNSVYLGGNKHFAQDAGFEDPADIVGKSDFEMGWREQAERYRFDDRSVMDAGLAKLNFEEPQSRDNKEGLAWLRTSKVPLRNTLGETLGVLGTYEDITEDKLLKEELELYRTRLEELVDLRTRELEEANRELEAFSFSVSHDLRAPLRAVDGFCQLMAEECASKMDERCGHYLGQVRAGVSRMGALIDDLLTLSRLSREEMACGPVSLGAIAAVVFDELRRGDPKRACSLDLEPGLRGLGDARLLKIMMANLIGNAWKFSGEAPEAKIWVGGSCIDGVDAFFVRDNGVGFDAREADKLFVPFQRLHSPGRFPGSGIGLSIAQRVVAKHGGRIWAASEVGRGATFYFTLPESGSLAEA